MNAMYRTKRVFWILDLLILGTFLALLSFIGGRFDLTQNRIYTLSSQSRRIVADLRENVYLTYIVSPELENFSSIPRSVMDFLFELRGASKSRLVINRISPDAPGLQIESLGLAPRQQVVVSNNQQTMQVLYSGIVLEYQGQKKVLPALFGEEVNRLEYELVKNLEELLGTTALSVGLVGEQNLNVAGEYRALMQVLGENYNIEIKVLDQDLFPQNTPVLMLIGSDFSDQELFYLDQYMMHGGNVLFFVNGVDINIQIGRITPLEEAPLLDLLSSHGVEVERALLAHTQNGLPITVPQGNFFSVINYPLWFPLSGHDINKDSPITRYLGKGVLVWGSPISFSDSSLADSRISESPLGTPLLSVKQNGVLLPQLDSLQPQSVTIAIATQGFQSRDENGVAQDFSGEYDVALALEGTWTSYFADKTVDNEIISATEGYQDEGQARFLVVGSKDFVSDVAIQSANAQSNLNFTETALLWLGGRDNLLGMQSKSFEDSTLSGISTDKERLRAHIWLMFVNIVLLPLGIVGYGFLRFILRRRLSKNTKGTL